MRRASRANRRRARPRPWLTFNQTRLGGWKPKLFQSRSRLLAALFWFRLLFGRKPLDGFFLFWRRGFPVSSPRRSIANTRGDARRCSRQRHPPARRFSTRRQIRAKGRSCSWNKFNFSRGIGARVCGPQRLRRTDNFTNCFTLCKYDRAAAHRAALREQSTIPPRLFSRPARRDRSRPRCRRAG